MISLDQLQGKIEKLYPKLLAEQVAQEEICPLFIPADKTLPDEFAGRGSGAACRPLPNLNPEEQQLYAWLCNENRRLEQERIPHHYALERIRERLAEG